MQKTSYQTPELRDANDNVVQEGAFGKNTALSNSTNDGWIDYVMNDLEALHDTIGDSAPTLDGNGHVVEPANLAIGDEDGVRLKTGYVKTSGGTMTGTLNIAQNLKMQDNQENVFGGLYVPGTTAILQYLQLYGGETPSSNGGNLQLSGDGAFTLQSKNGTTAYNLIGGTDGTLKWRGNNVAVLASPNFIGNPTAPTQAAGNNSTSLATTAFVHNELSGYPIANNAGYHNSIYRGAGLGSEVTTAQYAEISAGTFRNMYIGDYWTINNVRWRIAAFDYFYNTGNQNCTTHHVVIVPDTNLATCKMNETNITTGAYIGSDFYTGNNDNTGFATAKTAINNAFGAAHILTHREYLQNAVTDGHQSGGAWYDSTVELMNEHMVYGGKFFENACTGGTVPNIYSIGKSQLPLFAHEPSRITTTNRVDWWLRSVVSATTFASVGYSGVTDYVSASYSLGVRPYFAIKS